MWRALKYITAGVIVLVVVLAQHWAYRTAEEREARSFRQQEVILAREAARAIERVLTHLCEDLKGTAVLLDYRRDEQGWNRQVLENFYYNHSDTLLACGIARSPEEITCCYPPGLGINLSPVDWDGIRRTAEVFVARPFNPVPHATAVAMFKQIPSRQPAVIFAVVDFNMISRRFIRPVKIGESCYAWLLSSDGTVLANPHNPERLGVNEYTYVKSLGDANLIRITEAMLKGEEGSDTYIWPGEGKKLLGYSPVRFGGMIWPVGVSADYSEVTDPLAKLRLYHFGLLVGAALLVGGLIVSWRYAERHALVARRQELRAGSLDMKLREQNAELLKTTNLLQSVLDCATSYGIMATDADGTITLWNRGAELMFGYTAQEMVGKNTPIALIAESEECPRDFPAFAKEMLAVREGNAEFTGIRKNKTRFPFHVAFSERRDTASGIVGYLLVTRDLTLQKALEKQIESWTNNLERMVEERTRALQESEAKYRALFTGARDGIVVIDKETGNIIHANPAFETMTGYAEEELRTKKMWELRPPDRIEEAKRHFYEVGDGRAETAEEIPILSKDGRLVEVEFSTRVGELRGRAVYECICRDITKRKALEEQLRESRSYLESILRDAPAGVNTTDLQGVLQIWGGNSEQMFGYREDEVVGKMTCLDLHADPAEGRRVLEIVTEWGQFSGEVTLKRKNGETFPSLLHVSKLKDAAGNHIGYAGFNIDITRRKELELQLFQAQKMENLSALAGGIAHDFNNILGGILSYASFLKSRVKPGDPFYRQIETIESSAIRASDLTQQLLSFSRAGKSNPMPASLNSIINETVRLVESSIGENITIKMSLEPNLFVARLDPTQIEQAILNICINARDAMPDGGELDIKTENVVLDEAFAEAHPGVQPGPHILVAISDNGVGMDEEVKANIFEPFFTTKESGKGTGLGLSIVYTIVKNHGGCVDVETAPGKGTTFRIYLPASGDSLGITDTEVTSEMPRGSETILVVDDSDAIVGLARQILEQLGYRVLAAKSGREAVEIYRQQADRIDLVILDVVMPGMDGPATYEELRRINSTVKVVLSSGYTSSALIEETTKAGVAGVLPKPYVAADLAVAVREALG